MEPKIGFVSSVSYYFSWKNILFLDHTHLCLKYKGNGSCRQFSNLSVLLLPLTIITTTATMLTFVVLTHEVHTGLPPTI